jgi:hypothetical protein
MISNDQRKLYWANLHAVFKVGRVPARQGPPRAPFGPGNPQSPIPNPPSLDEFREEFHRTHHLPASTKDFTKKDFDAFLAACAAITKPADLKPQLRAFDQPKTRQLWKINNWLGPQLGVLLNTPSPGGEGRGEGERQPPRRANFQNPQSAPARRGLPNPQSRDANAYIAKIAQDKFGKLPADLSDSPRSSHGSRYSQLDNLMFTIQNRIKTLRQERGWTVHELLCNAGLAHTCPCAACKKGRVRRSARTVPESRELANAPF